MRDLERCALGEVAFGAIVTAWAGIRKGKCGGAQGLVCWEA